MVGYKNWEVSKNLTTIFGSLVTAMVTPFKENLEIDHSVVEKLATYLADNGSDSIVVAGTTGESPTLSKKEKLELFRTVVNSVKGKAKVIAGTGGNNTRESVELTKGAEKTGVDGIMLVTPYYNKPPQEGLYNHFKQIAGATDLPVMLYNVPGRTSVNLTAETSLRLAEIDNIVAIKEASANLEQIANICSDAPTGFAVYSGDDSMTLPVLSVGGTGVVSIASHLVGRAIKEMIEAYFNGESAKAAKLHQHLLPLFKSLFLTTNPIPLKAALNLVGFRVGLPRLPLTPLPENLMPKLEAILSRYNLK